ncbi:unnamed protein product, partial [Vitis vinifera]
MKETEKSLDSQLWHACAGGMVQMPLVSSKVFYFPQGHAEHAHTNVDFAAAPRIPALVLCRVAAVKFMADPETDETVIAKDVHGEIWKFRHIYRGTPRRHLLTTGWSTFVNQKKLVAGDSIVFLRAENGDLCVGIRRAKRGIAGSGGGLRGGRRVRPESVVEAATLAANGQPFEVVYYPRASTPEFCVKASGVRSAVRIQWCSGMRFKMPFETEDSSRISWFMGTISSVQVADPIRWPNSPWRLLQVTWDEPDLLQNVKRVSPWLVELVSNMPIIHLSPFSPPRKKLRIPQHPDFPFDGQFPMSSFSSNPLGSSSPLCCLPDNTPAGIQGARHAQYGISLSDLHLNNKLQSGLKNNESISCLLTMGNSSQNLEKSANEKTPQFLLFGQPILTEQQMSRTCSSDAVSQVLTGKKNLSNVGFSWHQGFQTTEIGLDTGHCKVFMESEDVGRSLDLSVLGSYEELYTRLANMFGIERSETFSHVLYRDATGAVKHTGDEPFSDFTKKAKRLTILMDSGSNNIGRTWITGMRNAENGLDSSNKTGPLSIFA